MRQFDSDQIIAWLQKAGYAFVTNYRGVMRFSDGDHNLTVEVAFNRDTNEWQLDDVELGDESFDGEMARQALVGYVEILIKQLNNEI